LRAKILLLSVVLAGCGDVKSFEQTERQFKRDREAFVRLAAAVIACDEDSQFAAGKSNRGATCAEGIGSELSKLGLQSAWVSADRTVVEFQNGNDGTSLGVMSGIAYYIAAQPELPGRPPLTGGAGHWFYFQHD
jgi:hypothetical protein